MIHILLIDNRPEFIKRFKLKLLTHLQITAIAKDNITEASEMVDLIPNIKLVCGLDSFDQETKNVQMLKVYMESKQLEVDTHLYHRKNNDTEILNWIAKKLNIPFDPSTVNMDEYFNYHPIPVKTVQGLETPCDLYIRVGKEEQSQQFIKRVSAFDLVDDDLFAKLLSFSVDNVYIHRDDYEIFFTSLSNNFVKNLQDSAPLDNKIKAQFEAYQYIIQYSNNLKFEKHIRDITESMILSVRETITTQKSLSDLINKIINQKDSIQFQTFYLTNLLSSFLLKREGTLEDRALNNLVFASMFCDFGLDDRNIFFINSQVELDEAIAKKNITNDEAKMIRTHAIDNSKMLENYPGIRKDVITLVRQHHGSDMGLSFVDNPDDTITPLSKLFITANTFIKYFLNPTYKFNKKSILEKLTLRFSNDPSLRRYTNYLSQKID